MNTTSHTKVQLTSAKPDFTWFNYLNQNIAVRCRTEAQAEAFLSLCKENNIPHVPQTFWKDYKSNTCYEAYPEKCVGDDTVAGLYETYDYFLNECYLIYDFSEIDFRNLKSNSKSHFKS